MGNQDDYASLRQSARVQQMIAGALCFGVVSFMTIALFIVFAQTGGAGLAPPQGLPIMTIVAVVLVLNAAPLSFIIPGLVTRNSLRQIAANGWQMPAGVDPAAFDSDAAKLLVVRQTSTIIGLALLEAAAFMGCIAFLLEANPISLGIVLAAVLLMLVNFPTESRVVGWLEKQAEQLAELRRQ